MRLLAGALAVLAATWLACAPEPVFPGDEVMGTFSFAASRVKGGDGDCAFSEAQDSFDFQGTFSRFPDAGQIFFTVNGVSRDGGFDGQVAEATLAAARQFSACSCSTTQVEETIRVALLSRSQDEHLDGRCPPAPLDGGVPASGSDDGGVRGPGSTASGFDALRACGELIDRVLPGEECACEECRMTYRLEGIRR